MKSNENPLANGIVDIDVYTFLYVKKLHTSYAKTNRQLLIAKQSSAEIMYRISKSKVNKLHTTCAEITLDCAAIKR